MSFKKAMCVTRQRVSVREARGFIFAARTTCSFMQCGIQESQKAYHEGFTEVLYSQWIRRLF